MYQSGPFGPTHSTAGTFAFRRSLLQYTQYDDDAAIAEERSFLKEYTIPLVQLDPMKTILVFSHNHNSFDKKNMLAMGENKCFKKSNKKVRDFIKQTHEENIYQFFMKNIDFSCVFKWFCEQSCFFQKKHFLTVILSVEKILDFTIYRHVRRFFEDASS